MIHSNLAWRAIGVLGMVSLLSSSGWAQSVLNFTSRELAGIGITNTTPYAADVKFTLYNENGSLVTAGVLNPVSRRIPGKGQISVRPSDVFRFKEEAPQETWVQVSSSVSGLEGFYFGGEAAGYIDPEPATPLKLQTIPYLPSNPRTTTSLFLTNPTAQTANVTIIFYDAVGAAVKPGLSPFQLPAHARTSVRAVGASARITADVAVLATAVQASDNLPILVNGQGPRSQGQRLVAPFFRNDEATRSALLLTNPGSLAAAVRVSFFTDSSKLPGMTTVVVPSNGSAFIDPQMIVGASNGSSEGWLLVEATAPVSGLALLTSEISRTALPLQPSPLDRTLFSRFLDGADYVSSLSLVGNPEREAVVTVTLNRPDGSTVAQRELTVPPLSRISGKVRDLLPTPEDFSKGFITIQSTAGVYGLELIEAFGGPSDAGMGPRRLSRSFQPGPVVALPRILGAKVVDSLGGVNRLKISTENIDGNPTLFVGGQPVPTSPNPETAGEYIADLPPLEPGFINVKLRVGGMDSNSYFVGTYPSEADFIPRVGEALFQKVEVTANGLDFSRTVMVPIRNARVEVVDRVTQQIVSVTETDEQGAFLAAVPDRPGLTIRVLSRLRSADVKVIDNFSNRLYAVTKDIADPRDLADIEMVDTSRVSGAFNILDLIQRANAFVAESDSQLVPPPLTIYWSEKNNEAVLARLTGGAIRATFFNPLTNTAHVLGDRSTDSDEFDDSVILHEYAHMLAVRFSHDDSPGGPHEPGDLLDPRVAWSEGWATFFSSAVRGTPIYLDSKGPGVSIRYDLEENVPAGDRQTYRSEAAVQGLLWDLFDENPDAGDSIQLPFASIWSAFTDLRSDRFVYLPYFLEHFLNRNPSLADELRTMVVLRNIDFQPGVRPSVANPFPVPMSVGETRKGDVDSYTTKRTNLANSAHFYRFTTQTGGQAFITLDIDGLGPANNLNANDLDLFLYDANGKRIAQSDMGAGRLEVIPWMPLAPGTYYIEVRSYYIPAETNTVVFNSGHYQLSVKIQ